MGISTEGCIIDLGIEHSVIEKSGSFFSFNEERLGQGRNNVKGFLRENPDIARTIEDKIYEALGIDRSPSRPVAVADPPAEDEVPEATAPPDAEAQAA